MVITNLNICVDTSIGSLSRLVPLGLVEFLVVVILHNDVGNVYVYISVYIGIGGGNWLSQQGPTCRVERDRRYPGPIVTPSQLPPPQFFNTNVFTLIAQYPLQLQGSYFDILQNYIAAMKLGRQISSYCTALGGELCVSERCLQSQPLPQKQRYPC